MLPWTVSPVVHCSFHQRVKTEKAWQMSAHGARSVVIHSVTAYAVSLYKQINVLAIAALSDWVDSDQNYMTQ